MNGYDADEYNNNNLISDNGNINSKLPENDLNVIIDYNSKQKHTYSDDSYDPNMIELENSKDDDPNDISEQEDDQVHNIDPNYSDETDPNEESSPKISHMKPMSRYHSDNELNESDDAEKKSQERRKSSDMNRQDSMPLDDYYIDDEDEDFDPNASEIEIDPNASDVDLNDPETTSSPKSQPPYRRSRTTSNKSDPNLNFEKQNTN